MESSSQYHNLDQLIVAARQGERAAFGRLLGAMYPYLLTVATNEIERRLQAKYSPADLVQETYLRACFGFDDFRGGNSNEIRIWLTRILKNYWVDVQRAFFRSAKRCVQREQSLESIDGNIQLPSVEPSNQLLQQQEERELMMAAIAELDDRTRQIVSLRVGEEMTFAEIATRLGCSSETVRRSWHQGVIQLRRILRAQIESN